MSRHEVEVVVNREMYLRIRNLLIKSGFVTHSHDPVTNETEKISDDFPVEKIIFMNDTIVFRLNYNNQEPPNPEVISKIFEGKGPICYDYHFE